MLGYRSIKRMRTLYKGRGHFLRGFMKEFSDKHIEHFGAKLEIYVEVNRAAFACVVGRELPNGIEIFKRPFGLAHFDAGAGG